MVFDLQTIENIVQITMNSKQKRHTVDVTNVETVRSDKHKATINSNDILDPIIVKVLPDTETGYAKSSALCNQLS